VPDIRTLLAVKLLLTVKLSAEDAVKAKEEVCILSKP
jgi:hypothetical protein